MTLAKSLQTSGPAEGQVSAAALCALHGLDEDKLARIRRLIDDGHVDPQVVADELRAWTRGAHRHLGAEKVDAALSSATLDPEYWRRFLRARVDDAYVDDRRAVGRQHVEQDLPPEAFTAQMTIARASIRRAIDEAGLDEKERSLTQEAGGALLQLDTGLVMAELAAHSARRGSRNDELSANYEEVNRVVAAAAVGNFDLRYIAQSEDDETLERSINELLASFSATVHQVRAVADGDYRNAFEARSDEDQLGRELSRLTNTLRNATERSERDRWMQKGQSDLLEQMRGGPEVDVLARRVLAYVADRVGAPVGAVFAPTEDGSLRRSAVFGIAAEDVPETIRPGEGLVGEIANAHRAVFDLDVSANPVRGSYGLGEILLKHIAVIPLVSDDSVRGVLQLALPRPLDAIRQDWLQSIAENVAIAMEAAESRALMKVLLEKSEVQSLALREQAEELRTSNEELEVSRKEIEARNEALERQQRDLETAAAELEERAQQLDRASKYKSEFLANMSHELRTPLNSMLILSEGLCHNPDGNLTERQLDSLRIIDDGGRELLRIINDILDLSKVEAGRMTLQIQPESVQGIVDTMHDQFTAVAEKKNVALTVEVDERVPDELVTDGRRLEQILRNLIGNALKFTPQGSVSVRVQPVASTMVLRDPSLDASSCLAIAVRDTGIGISRENHTAVFEAFQQADGSTSRTYGGTGLGLAVSRQLATLLAGEIHLESELGHGSTFTLVLPVRHPDGSQDSYPRVPRRPRRAEPRPASPATPAPKVAPPPLEEVAPEAPASERALLIVEDDAVFAELLAERARGANYDPVICGSGKEAILVAQRIDPKGIVLDLGLPDIDGMKVLEQLKQTLTTRHIPVHVVSAHACRAEVLRLGALGFVQKPIGEQDMVGVFERLAALESRPVARVLVVEDDVATQTAIREALDSPKLELFVVDTAEAALEALSAERFDCIVLDLRLPDMSGEDLLAQLDESHPPVVVYTASELDDVRLVELSEHTHSIVLKGARTPDRLLDEVSLFLHQVERDLPAPQRATLNRLYDKEEVLRGRKALVVDDDMRNVFALTELLQRHGLEVVQAKNGKVALEQLDAHPNVDVVVMDIMMPIMDGYEATRRIRALPEYKELPIIAVTAKTLPEDRDACLAAGASDYISKPMSPENLLALMRVLLFQNAGTANAT
ncbi:MAG: response regulator [Deltaproteobacteria bacterium]